MTVTMTPPTQSDARTITHRDRRLSVVGTVLAVGDKAPDAVMRAGDQSAVALSHYNGRVRLISVVPALDTYICDLQTKRFNEEAAALGDEVVIITVSAEHPYNQRRWCGANEVNKVIVLSDHMDMSFGDAYGTHIREYRLDQRAIFVVDRDDTITYVEYVPEIAQHPDYEAALAAVGRALAPSPA